MIAPGSVGEASVRLWTLSAAAGRVHTCGLISILQFVTDRSAGKATFLLRAAGVIG